jgi:hypothetical protein
MNNLNSEQFTKHCLSHAKPQNGNIRLLGKKKCKDVPSAGTAMATVLGMKKG